MPWNVYETVQDFVYEIVVENNGHNIFYLGLKESIIPPIDQPVAGKKISEGNLMSVKITLYVISLQKINI